MISSSGIDALGLANFRCLVETGLVELKPLTLLVGSNSSGKSTFLRAFPLLKQSIETTTCSPLLWYGRYVDYGSLEEVKHSHYPDEPVQFSFAFRLSPIDLDWRHLEAWAALDRHVESLSILSPLEETRVTVTLSLAQRGAGNGTQVVGARITYGDLSARISFDSLGRVATLTVGAFDVLAARAGERPLAILKRAYVVPTIACLTDSATDDRAPWSDAAAAADGEPEYQAYVASGGSEYLGFHFVGRDLPFLCTSAVVDVLRCGLDRDSPSTKKMSYAARRIRLGSGDAMVSGLANLPGGVHWDRAIGRLTAERVEHLRERVLANGLPFLLRYADYALARFASGIQYMGPMRAKAERYYRAQDLALRELDSRGENLPMFLRSLSGAERKSLSDFAEQHFNFGVSARTTTSGHTEILVREHSAEREINLADTGFGYSQLLPLVAQLWSTGKRTIGSPTLLAIEQPELHLHPAHQARLADMFVGVLSAKMDATVPKIVVETHSEALINRVGELIRAAKLRAADVQIAVFDKDEAAQEGHVSMASFDDEGALRNWPFGFFSAT